MYSLRALTAQLSVWIILINVLVYSVLVYKGVSAISPTPLDLIYWGGNMAPITLIEQPWRLFTSMFLHGGLLHLTLNMFMLFQIGMLAEMVWGRWRFFLIYILSGLFGSVASSIWYGHWSASNFIVSVGASGALMGISGACLVHSLVAKFKTSDVLDGQAESAVHVDFQALLKVVGVNLAMGFAIPGVDNACHVGGVLSGMLIAVGYLIPLPMLKLSQFRSPAVILLAGLGIYFLLGTKPDERLESTYRSIKEELSAIEILRARNLNLKIKENLVAQEASLIPKGVSQEVAAGKMLALNGGEEIGFNETRNHAYVTDINNNSLYVIDVENLKIIKTIQGHSFPKDLNSGCSNNLCRGQGAAGVAVSKNEGWAIVTSMVRDHAVFVDLVSGKIESSLKLGRFPRDVVLSPDEARAFVLNAVDNSVSVIDIKTRSLLTTVSLDTSGADAAGQPFGRALGFQLNSVLQELYVVNANKNEIAIFDIKNPQKIIKTVLLGDFSPSTLQLSKDGRTLWIAGFENFQFQILVYDTTWMPLERYRLCNVQQVKNVALSPNGQWFAINNQNLKRVFVVSQKSLKTVRVFPGSASGMGLHFSDDSSKLYGLTQLQTSSSLTEYNLAHTLDVPEQMASLEELVCPDLGQ